LAYSISEVAGYFIHLNSPIRFGWFNRVVSSPQTHRIHHSNLPEHMDKNFSTMLPLWDILFGTYYHPEEHEWPSTGVTGVKVTSLWQAVVQPFVSWSKMLRELRQVSRIDGSRPAHRSAERGDVVACAEEQPL
jgi:sterol desaturase/sphingolipid hydroxylase (fatty acid hydroxylase superfamily)